MACSVLPAVAANSHVEAGAQQLMPGAVLSIQLPRSAVYVTARQLGGGWLTSPVRSSHKRPSGRGSPSGTADGSFSCMSNTASLSAPGCPQVSRVLCLKTSRADKFRQRFTCSSGMLKPLKRMPSSGSRREVSQSIPCSCRGPIIA